MFVCLTFSMTLEEVIAGCEDAWAFFGGVFAVVVPEYVARHIFRLLCPAALCGRGDGAGPGSRREGRAGACPVHITLARREAASSSPVRREEVAMLEDYFVKPDTVDRIRASWIGPQIEQYVIWLADRGYGARCVWRRVPLLVAFGEFARLQGARSLADLPGHVGAFVDKRAGESRDARRGMGNTLAKDIRGPVEQMLELVVAGFEGTGRPHHAIPFAGLVPGFFEYLTSERGLRPASVTCYRHHLDRFEAYLQRVGVAGLGELSPALLSAFVAERTGAGLAKTTVREGCGVLRVFLRYAHREGLVRGDLWKAVEWPQACRLSTIPRVDLLGGRRQGPRRRGSPHAVREAGLRDLAAAGDLWPSRPRGRGADPG